MDHAALQSAIDELGPLFEEHSGILTFITGTSKGKNIWVYALIPPHNWPAFQYAQSQGAYALGDYASDILAQGEGDSPPEETLAQIKAARPDICFGIEEEILAAAQAA